MAPKRLLIVDDEPRFAAFVAKVAGRLGFTVEVTVHGREFKEAYLRSPPDVVAIDMVMPDIDGNELILWLVDQRCRADIIIMTGYHPDYAVNARILAEFKGLRSVLTLGKPISVATLRETLTALRQNHPPEAGGEAKGG